MKNLPRLALILGLLVATTGAAVVRPAPDLSLQAGGRVRSLKSLQGQAVVLLLAESPSTRAFKRQVKEIEVSYDHFATSKVVFVAAFRDGSLGPIASNIPFVISSAGNAACQAYALKGKFGIAIIGADGNLDYQTDQELHANRIREVLQNSFTVQQSARRR
jgi:hypothetical protein